MWCAIAVLLVAGVVGVAASQTPKPVSSVLKSWQNQPDKAHHADQARSRRQSHGLYERRAQEKTCEVATTVLTKSSE